MSSLISVRVSDELFNAVKTSSHFLEVPQADYIRQAIQRMNAEITKRMREKKLKAASLLVRKESMKVNAEFDEIEYDIED